MITIILFLIVLGVLVAVHETGHFLAAKKVGARVKEFAIGFPPRIFSRKKGDTLYSIGAVPIGGFVAIAGEEGDEEDIDTDIPAEEKLSNKHPLKKAGVLAAGVMANVIFAWILLSVTLMLGTFEPAEKNAAGAYAPDARVMVLSVYPDSPAQTAGMDAGDEIVSIAGKNATLNPKSAEEVISFLSTHQDEPVSFTVNRGGGELVMPNVVSVPGLVAGKKAVGIGVETVVQKSYSFFTAFAKGVPLTFDTVKTLTVGTAEAIWRIVRGQGSWGTISGPVGIGKVMGEARALGFVSILTFAAFLSLDLAVINILPFPALDGGRIVFALAEWITGKKVSGKVSRAVHGAGFAILIVLLLLVTVHDISKLFS